MNMLTNDADTQFNCTHGKIMNSCTILKNLKKYTASTSNQRGSICL